MSDSTLPPCPSREELSSYQRGDLTEDALVAVADHLAGCPRCEAVLAELEATDSLVEQLRGPAVVVGEPECATLEARARAIPLRSSHLTTVPPNGTPEPLPASLLGTPFGAYELFEKIGRGGMGIVHRARHRDLKKVVAIKMLLAGADAASEEVARFRREAEATARLRHENVVQVYDFGEQDGRLYYVMELVEGGSLATRLSRGALPATEAARLVATLARVVQATHEHQIVHRDLKPANILLQRKQSADSADSAEKKTHRLSSPLESVKSAESVDDFLPKIGDFGLARLLDAEPGLTRSEAVLGTPSYMAPEQARGDNKQVGPLADVYALGAILYECLTGKPVFQGESRSETLEMVCTREPEPPSRKVRGLSHDLEAVCLKCLAKVPGARYASAAALADDLERWLRGDPTEVRPPGRLRRTWLGLRRHPRVIGATALLLAILGGLLALWYFDPERPRRSLEARLARGETVELIGDTGVPRWHHWLAGEDKGQTTLREDTFTISSWSVGLVELVHDPQCDHYEVTAQVRHLSDDHQEGSVGLFFGYQRRHQADETFQLFGRLSFADMHDDQEQFNRLPDELKKLAVRPPPGNPVSLAPHLIDDRSADPWDRGVTGRERRLFKPVFNQGPYVWRTLVVEVAPDRLRAWWGGDRREVGEFSAGDYRRSMQTYLASLLKERPNDPLVMELPTIYLPRAPLGLFVQNGSASFRRVRITPLSESR